MVLDRAVLSRRLQVDAVIAAVVGAVQVAGTSALVASPSPARGPRRARGDRHDPSIDS